METDPLLALSEALRRALAARSAHRTAEHVVGYAEKSLHDAEKFLADAAQELAEAQAALELATQALNTAARNITPSGERRSPETPIPVPEGFVLVDALQPNQEEENGTQA